MMMISDFKSFSIWTDLQQISVAHWVLFCASSAFLLSLVKSFITLHLYGGPQVWPVVGTAFQHIRNYHRLHDWLLDHLQSKNTLVTPMPLNRVFYYTVDPANVKHLLKTNFANYPKGEMFYERMQVLLGDGIFNTDGDTWRSQRKTAAAEFSLRSLRDFSCVTFQEHACKLAGLLVQSYAHHMRVDAQDLFMRTTLDSIGKLGFGVDIGSLPERFPLPNNDFATAFDRANEVVTSRFIDPFWKLKRYFSVGIEAQLSEHVRTIEKFVYGVIRQRKQEYEQLKNSTSDHKKADIISRFLDFSGSGEHAEMSDQMLKDVVLNFVIAGRDTTAVTMSWLIYSLTDHQDVADRLWKELQSFHRRNGKFPMDSDWFKLAHESKSCSLDEHDGATGYNVTANEAILQTQIKEFAKLLTYESLKQLTYLQAVINETLRLYPAVPLDPKGIVNNDILPDGTRVKKGQMIAYAPWCMARKVSIWGPDALKFNPDRWIKKGEIIHESEFKFATFQAGYRTCLGKDAAYLQMKMVIATLCRFFSFRRTSNKKLTYRMMATLIMDGGLEIAVSPHEDIQRTLHL